MGGIADISAASSGRMGVASLFSSCHPTGQFGAGIVHGTEFIFPKGRYGSKEHLRGNVCGIHGSDTTG